MNTNQISFLSVGHLRDAVTILRNVKRISKEKKVSYHTLLEIINSVEISEKGANLILKYLQEIQILKITESSQYSNETEIYVEISNEIIEILDEERIVINREMLWNYIETTIPSWTRHLKYGIENTKKVIGNTNIKQIFRESGLFFESDSKVDHQIIEWWNRASQFSRHLEDARNVKTGHQGELLTLNFEKQRTNQTPKHVSLQSAEYGYDILSIIDQNNKNELCIEVKTTMSGWNNGYIHISSNEASKCETLNEKYVFYLWNIRAEPFELKIIKGDIMSTYFPINQKNGIWENVRIPLKVFKDTQLISYEGE